VSLSTGTRLGPYEILASLGAGGMGEVYKAKDTRLDRLVAVKVLPDRLADSAEALARFEREAKLIAALNHPNILGIFDVGRTGKTAYAVMELLEGESLRARLSQGPLAPRRATELAVQMAEGLAAAHEKGVLHRDLKPENLWITREGRLKILDFGLAKQVAPREPAGSVEPTSSQIQPHQTEAGKVFGTLAYMSPEQVRGEAVDARSDIFSFGMVFFEMLTRERAFARDNPSDTMAAILRDEPEEQPLVASRVPPPLQRVVLHCLEKPPGRRFQTARDLGFALETALGDSTPRAAGEISAARAASGSASSGQVIAISGDAASATARGRATSEASPANASRGYLLGAILGFLGLLLGAGLAFLLRPAPEPAGVVAIRLATYSGHDTSPAVSPDGKTVAFTSDRDGRPRIWLKQLKGGGELALTDGPDDFPRFSPDGTSLLFIHVEAGKTFLYRTSLLGNDPHKVVDDAEQADWSPDGRQIAFVRLHGQQDRVLSTLFLINADGGSQRELKRFEGELTGFPRFSPDGRRIIVNTPPLITSGVNRKLFLVDAKDGKATEIHPPTPVGMLSSAAWVSASEIAYLKSESLSGGGTAVSSARAFAQNVDTSRARSIFWVASSGLTLDLLRDGRVIFDSMMGRQNLREYDLQGNGPPRWITHGTVSDRQPVFAPDGEWVVFSSNRSGNLDLWGISTRTGVVRSITDDPAEDWDPAFSPDGSSLLWSSNRSGNLEIWSSRSDGSGAHQVTHDGEDAQNPTQTMDGRWIVYSCANRKHPGIWKIHPDGSGAAQLSKGPAQLPQVSPDGLYATYMTTFRSISYINVVRVEDGQDTRFAVLKEPKRKTSVFPGRARWLPDGRRIIFTGQDDQGLDGVFVQDFVFGKDTQATRRPFAGFDPDWITESLGLSPDGRRLVLSQSERVFSLMIADGVPGLQPQK